MSFKLTSLLFSVGIVCSLLSQCNAQPPNYAKLQADLDDARATWKAENIASYRMTITRQCFCIRDAIGPFVLTVSGNSITSASPNNQFANDLPTVVGLFGIIQNAINDKVAALTVTYDAKLGYPTEVSIDRVRGFTIMLKFCNLGLFC